jgi:hypothetical protein
MHEDVWSKWRVSEKPNNWKIMTKVEHTKRTAEYVALLEKENPRGMRKTKVQDSDLPAIERPAIARPAALPMDLEIVPAYTCNEITQEPKGKRKRNRRKDKSVQHTDAIETNTSHTAAGAAGDDEPSSKRRG